MSLHGGGVISNNTAGVPLFTLRNANMQLTSDQMFTPGGIFTNYVITQIVAVRKTGSASVLTAGGIYTGASKSGSAIVSALQLWTTLSGLNKIIIPGLASLVNTDQLTAIPVLSLTIGSTSASTADIFINGFITD